MRTKEECRDFVRTRTKQGNLDKKSLISDLVGFGVPYPGAKNFMDIGGGYWILEKAKGNIK